MNLLLKIRAANYAYALSLSRRDNALDLGGKIAALHASDSRMRRDRNLVEDRLCLRATEHRYLVETRAGER